MVDGGATQEDDPISSGYTLTEGAWHHIAVVITWDYNTGGNGEIRVYASTSTLTSGDLVIDYQGPTGAVSDFGINYKIGIYKWVWKNTTIVEEARSESPAILERRFYYDNPRIDEGDMF